MDLRPITDKQKNQYNKLVTHVMQSFEWGEFRKSLGIPVLRYGLYQNGKLSKAFQLTLHKIPFTNQSVGYLPKGPFPDKELAEALKKIGKDYNCAFIKIEPNVIENTRPVILSETKDISKACDNSVILNPELDSSLIAQNDNVDPSFIKSSKPLFTKYNFILDLTKSEEELLKNMHPKTRYNIKVAQKHGVVIKESTDDQEFETHLKLYFDTVRRQNYHGHNRSYHQKAWQVLKEAGLARVLIAYFQPPETNQKIPLASWVLLNFKDTLYYPFGGSSEQYKNVMASTLLAWEAIKLGKRLKLKKFDLWGAADPNKGSTDSYFGFTQFKSRLGAASVEYLGTYDLVFNWPVYLAFTTIDRLTPLKVFLLKLLGK